MKKRKRSKGKERKKKKKTEAMKSRKPNMLQYVGALLQTFSNFFLPNLGRKHLGLTNFFSFPPSNQTPTKKILSTFFSFLFLSSLFHLQSNEPQYEKRKLCQFFERRRRGSMQFNSNLRAKFSSSKKEGVKLDVSNKHQRQMHLHLACP